jgi:hypothetical protein
MHLVAELLNLAYGADNFLWIVQNISVNGG